MRLLLPALVLLALPASAQDADREPRRVVIDVDSVLADVRGIEVEIDEADSEDGRRIVIRRERRDGGDERVVEMRMPDPDQLGDLLGQMMETTVAVFRTDDGETVVERVLGDRGASPETRAQIRELESRARDQAGRVRSTDGRARRDAQAELDATLAELFEAQDQARRDRADALRDRAAALADQADEIEAALADRQSRRDEMIEARRRALLDGDR